MNEKPYSINKVLLAILLGYTGAMVWVIYADITYDNAVPLEDFMFHGLYPVSLGLSAVIAALVYDRSLKSLGFHSFRAKYIPLSLLFVLASLLIPFGVTLLSGFTGLNKQPVMDMEFVSIGFPVLLILSLGEEVMWRGIVYSELSKRYSFSKTAFITGIMWALWHYPVIIHTKFIYADRPLWFALLSFTIMVISASFVYNYLRKISGSVWPTIFLHAFVNYAGFVLIEPFEQSTSDQSVYFISEIGVFYTLIYVLAAVLVFKKVNGRSVDGKR